MAWDGDVHTDQSTPADLELDGKLQEALQAEQVAEQLAQEATRTWSQAKQATAALHRDRGFGKGKSKTIKCFNCGGDHYARDCPDRRHPSHPKGTKGKSNFLMDPYYEDFYQYGKSHKGKKKGKGKSAYFMDDGYDAMCVKGKSRPWHTGKGDGQQPTRQFVNSYASELLGLDMHQSNLERQPLITPSTCGDFEGVVDCGATVIQAIVAQDHAAVIELDQSARPYFRYGNGKWGQALYQVTLRSNLSGNPRQFKVFALPASTSPRLCRFFFTTGMTLNGSVPPSEEPQGPLCV